MALIACSECGRAVSNKAPACIGCGAPLPTASPINVVPTLTNISPPTRQQIKRRAILSLSVLVLGILFAGFLEHRPRNQFASFLAALIIIIGLSWFVVTLVHAASSRR
jgi:hypothetical protein